MANCKDCLHIDLCKDRYIFGDIPPCEHFKDSSKFVELPCKVRDTVYVIRGENKIQEKSIRIISILESNVIYYFDDGKFNSSLNDYCCENDFGKTVFLTREAAKQVLREKR